MTTGYQFELEKYKGPTSRYSCPKCGKPRIFVRYVSIKTHEQLAEYVGRCNREIECGYHYKPADFFRDNQIESKCKHSTQFDMQTITRRRVTQKEHTTSFLPKNYLEKSTNPDLLIKNNFVKYLKGIFGIHTELCLKRFFIGTAKRWPGATVFWYVDKLGNIRSGKIIKYDPLTGRRIKEPFPHITWVHSELIRKGVIKEFNLEQCLFGEHQLIKEPHKPIGIVESEKSAIIASMFLPELTWMACGSVNGISPKRFSTISRNTIVLYPDIKGYEIWERQANELRTKGFRITVSSLLETHPAITQEDRKAGLDLADFLLRLPLPLSILQKMEAKNPFVSEMVKVFDLVDIQ